MVRYVTSAGEEGHGQDVGRWCRNVIEDGDERQIRGAGHRN
jgi:hypothetical protein